MVIAVPSSASNAAGPQNDPPIDAPPWVYQPEAKGAIPISDANADLLKALAGLNQGTAGNIAPGQVPDDVLRYMATHPAYTEGQTIPNLPPAVRDLLSQEQRAAAQQGEPREAELNRQLWGMRDYPNVPPLNDMGNEQNSWRVSATVPAAPAPVTAGPRSFAAPAPPQSVSSFNQAVQQLGLTPQEQNLYQHHLNNLWGGGRVVQPGGDVSTVLQAVVQGPDGRYYNIPTVWNGAALPVDAAERQARLAGLGNFPAYATPQEADARYMAMHGMMERDTAAWLAQHPNADPLAQMLMRQQEQQHPVLQQLQRLRELGRQSSADPLPAGTQLAGDVVPLINPSMNQTGVAPGFAGAMQNYLDPSNRRWDMLHMTRPMPDDSYPPVPRYMTPANEASVSPDLLRLLNPPVA